MEYLPLTPSEAIAFNAKEKPTGDAGPPATPFRMPKSSVDFAHALRCLTDAVYHEAASQGADGQRAVAQVVLNRVRNPAFPATVCGVVFQGAERATGCQFTFTCDGSLARGIWKLAWVRAELIAKAALNGSVFKPVGYATHYHADWVVPYWASSLTRATTVGAHIFYRWKGPWGEPRAFGQRYAGNEVEPLLNSQQPRIPDPLQIDDPLHPDDTVTAPPGPIRADGPKAHSVLAADRAVQGSSLRIDEKPATLIRSLAEKPQLVADRPLGAVRAERAQARTSQIKGAPGN